jgi:ribose/xylose/arabinose/galactoside ABC-type transport system permease subunit
MNVPASPGPLLVTLGVGLVVLGLLVWSGALSWFGRLPGDLRIERESVHIYFPVVSMLAVSAALSLLLYLLRRFL